MMIDKYMNHPEIFECRVIDGSDIPFSGSVREACEANHCGKYGSSWTCPPGVGSIAEWEEKIKKYEKAVVFTCKHTIEDSFDFEGMMAAQKCTKQVLAHVIEQFQAAGEEYLALGCGSCDLCNACTYPNAPCRFPHKAIPSVEACGIDVVELAKRADIHYYNGTNTVTYFCILCLRCSDERESKSVITE